MRVSFLKIFAVVAIVVKWADVALEDGKVDSMEFHNLVVEMLKAVGLPASVELPDGFKHVSSL